MPPKHNIMTRILCRLLLIFYLCHTDTAKIAPSEQPKSNNNTPKKPTNMTKHRFLALLTAAFALCLAATPAKADDEQLIYSLDTGQGITGSRGNVGAPLKQDYDVAIRIADQRFAGMTITAVRVPVDTMTQISNLRVWLSKQLTLKTVNGKKTNVPDVLSQSAELNEGWVEVKLDQPYTITDEGIYVGYSFDMDEMNSSNRRPVRITTELHDGGLFLHTSRSYRNWTDVSDQCSSLLQVKLDGAPKYAAAALAGPTSYFGATGMENPVTFYVENHGATGVKSIEYSYVYGGNTYTGKQRFSTPLQPIYGVQAPFTVSLPAVDKKDYYDVDLTITKVNGGDNTDNERQLTQNVCIFDKLPKHRAVLEEYTGTWCGYCPRGYVGLAAMNRLHPDDFIAISYHNSESKDSRDPMEVMPGEDFPSQISGFPSAWLDRQYEVDAYGGFNASNPELGIDNAWQAVCELLAEADIDVTATLNDDRTAVDATASISFPLEIKNARYGVEFVLTADGLHGDGNGWTQKNYYARGKQGTDFSEPEFAQFTEADGNVSGLSFDDVALATTRLTGDNQYLPDDIAPDHTYQLNASFRLANVTNTSGDNIVQDPEKLRVVALLVDYNDGSVVNAAKSPLTGIAAGISDISAEDDNTAIAIYDLAGRRLNAMQQGLNIVRTADGRTSKIIIK